MNAVSGTIGALLRIQVQGQSWAVPLEAVECVSRSGDFSIDQEGSQTLIHDDEGPVPLASLGDSLDAGEHRHRIVWLRHQDERVALGVDEVGGHFESPTVFELPRLPFEAPQPILTLVGDESETIPVVDLDRLGSSLPPRLPERPQGLADSNGERQGEPRLMLLPALGTSPREILPALSAAQVLGFEAAGPVFGLPSLPAWCQGVGWWQGRPVGVFDLAGRLAPESTGAGTSARRWLLAAVPGGGEVALLVTGRCVPVPLPKEAEVRVAQGALADAIYGLFETPEHRLALLDLGRWCRQLS